MLLVLINLVFIHPTEISFPADSRHKGLQFDAKKKGEEAARELEAVWKEEKILIEAIWQQTHICFNLTMRHRSHNSELRLHWSLRNVFRESKLNKKLAKQTSLEYFNYLRQLSARTTHAYAYSTAIMLQKTFCAAEGEHYGTSHRATVISPPHSVFTSLYSRACVTDGVDTAALSLHVSFPRIDSDVIGSGIVTGNGF